MKKNIALLAGGYSGEYVISIGSAATIAANLDRDLYNIYTILVSREGWWYESDGRRTHIDRNDFSLPLESGRVQFDAAYLTIHGTPGEDGRMQGYLDMLGIPYTTCNSIVSALTFNKSYCNKVVKALNVVNIANSVHLIKGEHYNVGAILDDLRLPVFVKPNESGSSLGVSKVKTVEELLPAIEKAFAEDDQVLIEEFVEGRELTIGIYKVNGDVRTLPPTEVISKNEFFDYEAKYTAGVTSEVTPADIPENVLSDLQRASTHIYRHLNCRGVVRMDYILEQSSNRLFFLEVNTTPGQSDASIIPQQVRAAGQSLKDFYKALLDEAMAAGGA